MSLMEIVRSDMTAAMRAKDRVTLATLRSVIAAVQEAEVAGSTASTLDDAQVERVIAAQAKRRVEAAEAFESGGRPELAAAERAELAILEHYLPEQLDADALAILVDRVLLAGGYEGMKSMGQAMQAVNAEVAGRADGRIVADLVKSRLA